MKEWATNAKMEHLEKFVSEYNDAKFVCTAILDANNNVLSWLHSFVFVLNKSEVDIGSKLEALAVKGLKLQNGPYFIYKEIILP